MSDVRIVLTTVGVPEKAEQLARGLVERELVACVNIIGPIRSVYRWKSEIQHEQEYLLVIKTTADRSAALAAAFDELHSYEVPERIELEVVGGCEKYLGWVAAQMRGCDQ